jgi:imidazolonepropionase-like amidohydrolase
MLVTTVVAATFAAHPSAVAPSPAPSTTVFVAREVVTMDAGWPTATCVAVQDGRIISVGRTLEDLKPWMQASSAGTVTIDETFKDKVLVPGFIEHTAIRWSARSPSRSRASPTSPCPIHTVRRSPG